MTRQFKGFTLIEVAATVVLIALLAGAVSVTFFGWHSKAQMESVTNQLKHFDRINREYARSAGRPASFVIRAMDNQVIYTEGSVADIGITDDDSRSPNLRVYNLPDGYWIERIMIDIYEGNTVEAVIPISSRGQTPTYSLQIMNNDNKEHWLTFAGLTGQIIESKDDYQAQDIFTLLTSNSGTHLN